MSRISSQDDFSIPVGPLFFICSSMRSGWCRVSDSLTDTVQTRVGGRELPYGAFLSLEAAHEEEDADHTTMQQQLVSMSDSIMHEPTSWSVKLVAQSEDTNSCFVLMAKHANGTGRFLSYPSQDIQRVSHTEKR
jgi:hypothetical protein